MSNHDPIAAHHEKWSALPEFPAWPYVMTDDDVDFWGDILYMRGLVDEITASASDGLDHGGDLYLDVLLEALPIETWPEADRAADMLAAWRLSGHYGTAALAIGQVTA